MELIFEIELEMASKFDFYEWDDLNGYRGVGTLHCNVPLKQLLMWLFVLHTVCYIVDAVQITIALFVKHVLALASYDLQWVRFVEQLTRFPMH